MTGIHFRTCTLLATIILVAILPNSDAFGLSHNDVNKSFKIESALNAEKGELSRSGFISASVASVITFSLPRKTNAQDEEVVASELEVAKSPSLSIKGCPKPISGKPNNCVATANVKQLATYSPPWTFEVSEDEAFARLKGLIKSDPSFTVSEIDEAGKYIKIDVQRTFSGQDAMEFLVKGDDKVVIFKSYEKEESGISDFGANKKRVEELRKKSGGFFSLMGEGLGTVDSYSGTISGKNNGPLSQLKAFYGLQSGEGFKEVFEE